jgi:hypothetical protein
VAQTLGFSALPVTPLVAGAATVRTLAWAGRRRTRTLIRGTAARHSLTCASVFCSLRTAQKGGQARWGA